MKSKLMLTGEKVRLREKRLSDAAKDYAWRCDPELARLDALPPFKMSFQEYLAIYKDELRYPGGRQWWFAIETLEGKHIGNCMCYNIDQEKSQTELGILIGDRTEWDKGYGTDAVNTLAGYIFNELGLERIYLNTLDWNIRAQRCFHKCDFVPCGLATRQGNTFIIMELYQS